MPIEDDDRVPVLSSENKKLRRKVDDNLYELIIEDSLGILGKADVVEVTGILEKRVERILDLKLK